MFVISPWHIPPYFYHWLYLTCILTCISKLTQISCVSKFELTHSHLSTVCLYAHFLLAPIPVQWWRISGVPWVLYAQASRLAFPGPWLLERRPQGRSGDGAGVGETSECGRRCVHWGHASVSVCAVRLSWCVRHWDPWNVILFGVD